MIGFMDCKMVDKETGEGRKMVWLLNPDGSPTSGLVV